MAPQERSKTGLKLYVPPPPPPRPLAAVVPSQLHRATVPKRSMIRSRGSSMYCDDKEKQLKYRNRPSRSNKIPWDDSINHNPAHYSISVEDQIRQKVGMVVSSSRHNVMLQNTEALTEKQQMIWEKEQIQQHQYLMNDDSSNIHHRKSTIDAAKKRKPKKCSLNATAISNEYCSSTKTVDTDCFKDDSELSLKCVDGKQGGIQEYSILEEIEKLRGRFDILGSSSTLCQAPQDAEMTIYVIPIDHLEQDGNNKSSLTSSWTTDNDEEVDNGAEINNETTITTAATMVAKKKIFPRNVIAKALPDEQSKVDEHYSKNKEIERITTTATALPHNDNDDASKTSLLRVSGNASTNRVLLSNTDLINQLNEAEKKIREQQFEILELRTLLECGKKFSSSTPSMQSAAVAAWNASLQSSQSSKSFIPKEQQQNFQSGCIGIVAVTPDDHWGAALANVERLLNCPSPHENNVTNDEKIVIGGGPAPWNTVGGTTQMAFSDDAAKEGQLTGMQRSRDGKHDMEHPPIPQQVPQPLTTADVVK